MVTTSANTEENRIKLSTPVTAISAVAITGPPKSPIVEIKEIYELPFFKSRNIIGVNLKVELRII
ncbi:hypothetical protein [Lactococcus lactis]|uniref:hypothetical protein n=1 Tax=Lactococcus lactis TaxID=1358 RepID=UPI00204617CF|nr:hypothetical protein [Lactococcus lactis]UPS09147.1 hypothetical protein JRY11_000096 [Lactococcus lactis]